MKLLLTQHYIFNRNEGVALGELSQTDIWESLYLRCEARHETRTTSFLKQHLADNTLTEKVWEAHLFDLDADGAIGIPSFGWVRSVEPIQFVLYGKIQLILWRDGAIVQSWQTQDRKWNIGTAMVQKGDFWVLSASEQWYQHHYKLSLQKLLASVGSNALETYLEEWNYEQAGRPFFNGQLTQIKWVLDLHDLDDYAVTDTIKRRVQLLAPRTNATTQSLIDQFLRRESPKPVGFLWDKTPSRQQYNMLLADFYEQKRAIEVFQLNEKDKILKINELQQQLNGLNPAALSEKEGKIATLQTELDTVRTKLKITESKVNPLEAQIGKTQKELKNVQADNQLKVNLLQKQVEENTALKNANSQQELKMNALQKQLADANVVLQKVQTDNQLKIKQLQKYIDENTSLKIANSKQESEMNQFWIWRTIISAT